MEFARKCEKSKFWEILFELRRNNIYCHSRNLGSSEQFPAQSFPMRYTLEDTTEDEYETTDQVEGDTLEEEDDATTLQVTIPADGDCFYAAVVEAFLREGVDITAFFTGSLGCKVENC